MIISKRVQATPFRFKAPKDMLFEIWDIHISVTIAGAANYAVLNYLLEDDAPALIDLQNAEGLLALLGSDIDGQSVDFNFTKGERTKFISMVRNAAAGQVVIIIHYTLVKASKTELILEWFRKGA